MLPLAMLSACGSSGGDSDPLPADDSPATTSEPTSIPTSTAGSAESETAQATTAPLDPAAEDCSVQSQNRWVDGNMHDYYLFYDQVPTLNLDEFNSPEELIKALRVNPPDRFSNVQNAESQGSFFNDGLAFGFGFRIQKDDTGQWRFNHIRVNSPMADADIKRGDIFVAANGVSANELSEEQYVEFFGRPPNPMTVTLTITDNAGDTRDEVVTSAEYPVSAVSVAGIFSKNGIKYGYLRFETFIETAREELDFYIDRMAQDGVSELVLDLRYNGGGRTAIAQKLASQIAGPTVFGQTFEILSFNDKYTANNQTGVFPEEEYSLGVMRMVAITGPGTASSSELVINGLRPYIDVTVIGSGTTAAKPFQTSGRDFCGKRMNALEVISSNADGATVINGIEPDCLVADDITHEFGDFKEGMLNAALNYLYKGVCATPPAAVAQRQHSRDKLRSLGDIDNRPMAIID